MKRFFFLAILVAFILHGCAAEQNSGISEPAPFSQEELNDIELIASMGYDVSDAERFNGGYLVEEYIWITQEKLEEYRNLPPGTRLTDLFFGWLPAERQRSLSLSVNHYSGSQTLNGFLSVEMNNAITEWINISNCNIRFDAPYSAFININIDDDAFKNKPNLIMAVTPGQPGSVTINSSAISGITYDKARNLLLHCIGHALGFGHTGGIGSDPDKGYQINGTTGTDANSIMKQETSSLSWTGGFSSQDKADIPKIYPDPDKITITRSPNTNPVIAGTVYRFTTTMPITGANPAITVSPGGATVAKVSNGVYDVVFNGANNYTVTATTTGLVNNVSKSISINVTGNATINVTKSPDTHNFTGYKYIFTATPTSGSPASYQWTVKQGSASVSYTNEGNGKIGVVFKNAGNYTVTATATINGQTVTGTKSGTMANLTITLTKSPTTHSFPGIPYTFKAAMDFPETLFFSWTISPNVGYTQGIVNGTIGVTFPSTGS